VLLEHDADGKPTQAGSRFPRVGPNIVVVVRFAAASYDEEEGSGSLQFRVLVFEPAYIVSQNDPPADMASHTSKTLPVDSLALTDSQQYRCLGGKVGAQSSRPFTSKPAFFNEETVTWLVLTSPGISY